MSIERRVAVMPRSELPVSEWWELRCDFCGGLIDDVDPDDYETGKKYACEFCQKRLCVRCGEDTLDGQPQGSPMCDACLDEDDREEAVGS